MKFDTKRFIIRAYRKSDFEAWRKAHEAALPKQNEFDEEKKSPKELTAAAFTKFLRKNEKFRRDKVIFHFGVFEKKTGRLMGSLLFAFVLRFNVQSARISYFVFNNFWKRGYGSEIVEGGLQYAFRKLKLHRVEAEIQPGNRASIALAKHLGFQAEGLRRGAVYFDRRWNDHMVFAVLAEDKGLKVTKPKILR